MHHQVWPALQWRSCLNFTPAVELGGLFWFPKTGPYWKGLPKDLLYCWCVVIQQRSFPVKHQWWKQHPRFEKFCFWSGLPVFWCCFSPRYFFQFQAKIWDTACLIWLPACRLGWLRWSISLPYSLLPSPCPSQKAAPCPPALGWVRLALPQRPAQETSWDCCYRNCPAACAHEKRFILGVFLVWTVGLQQKLVEGIISMPFTLGKCEMLSQVVFYLPILYMFSIS